MEEAVRRCGLRPWIPSWSRVTVQGANAASSHLVPALGPRLHHLCEVLPVHVAQFEVHTTDGLDQRVDRDPPCLVELQSVERRLMSQGMGHDATQPVEIDGYAAACHRRSQDGPYTSKQPALSM